MTNDRDTTSESHLTADRETIESWRSDHDLVPVRHTGREGSTLRLVRESDRRGTDENVEWDEFYQEIEESDKVVVRHGDGDFEVIDRDEALGRASLDTEEVEQQLLEGESVTTEITETTVVERTIVEEATIQSEVVDREIVDTEIVDAELVSREVESCSVTLDEMTDTGEIDFAQFEAGQRVSDRLDVDVVVDEAWTLTKELLEQIVVESRVTGTEATETDTVESDTLRETVDVEGVERTILEGDLLGGPASSTSTAETGSLQTEFREDDVIETRLRQRSTMEDDVSVRKVFTGELTEGEVESMETISSTTVESDLVDETGEAVAMGATGAESDRAEVETDSMSAEDTATTETAGTGATGAGRVTLSDDDEGKTVVDATGEEVGMVVGVETDTAYVDPHPSLTDKIKAALDWGDPGKDAYAVSSERIAEITDDEVRLAVGE